MSCSFVTGPTGAIGIALISKLVEQGEYVYAICHTGSKRICNIPKNSRVQVVECNLESIKELAGLIDSEINENCNAFYHLAWDCTFGDSRNNVQAQIKNIQFTIDALETAVQLGCKRFVGAGSQAEYGRYDSALTSCTPAFPENGYGMAKLCAGNLSRLRAEQLGIEHIWTRILSVYGPNDGENTLISSLIRKLKSGDHISCTYGEQIWDYMHSFDAANALYHVGTKGISGKTYMIASGCARPLREYIECIKNMIDANAQIGYGEVPYSPLQVMHLAADISELTGDTGFVPEITFEEGIKGLI